MWGNSTGRISSSDIDYDKLKRMNTNTSIIDEDIFESIESCKRTSTSRYGNRSTSTPSMKIKKTSHSNASTVSSYHKNEQYKKYGRVLADEGSVSTSSVASTYSMSKYRPYTATSSAARKQILSAEFRSIKSGIENSYSKYRTGNAKEDFGSRYTYWGRWFRKHNSKVTVRITKREFEKLWLWFTSRLEEHRRDDGVKIDKVVDDFIYHGVFTNRFDAVSLLRRIDTDHSGTISFQEFMEGVNSGDMQQIIQLRHFMSTLASTRNRPLPRCKNLPNEDNPTVKLTGGVTVSSSIVSPKHAKTTPKVTPRITPRTTPPVSRMSSEEGKISRSPSGEEGVLETHPFTRTKSRGPSRSPPRTPPKPVLGKHAPVAPSTA